MALGGQVGTVAFTRYGVCGFGPDSWNEAKTKYRRVDKAKNCSVICPNPRTAAKTEID